MAMIKAVGRYGAYGSTRYSSKGSTKKAPRLKALGTVSGGMIAGQVIGGGIGHLASGGKQGGAYTGGQIGALAGGMAGRRVAKKAGYIHRTKQRMSLRAVGSSFGKADTSYSGRHNAKLGVRSNASSPVRTKGRVHKKGY